MTRRGGLAPLVLGLAMAVAPLARADSPDKIGKRLDALSTELKELSRGIGRSATLVRPTRRDMVGQRIVKAQASFGSGDYDGAALVLYELVERFPNHADTDIALYYLAESLFQKGDTVAARKFFTRLATDHGARSKFYRQSLERLIQLTLLLGDGSGADAWLKALDKVPAAEQRSSVPYVRGKYYYHRKKFDEAVAHFAKVAKSSPYYFQARYFLGVARTAKGDIKGALASFKDLIAKGSAARTDDQRRVVELAHLAIGRLHYERDRPARAIDSYLNINRSSSLFPEVLFEAAWVYIKNDDYDKALRALEFLALSDPNSFRMPEVRILEANLRIRRAKKLEKSGRGNPLEEYTKAQELFEQTRTSFEKPHQVLAEIVASGEDPRLYIEQITGRESARFQAETPLPEVAASWLKREPEIERYIAAEQAIAYIQGEIAESEQMIERLERATDAPTRVNLFPELASKRARGISILEEVLGLRSQLASRAGRTISASSSQRAELAKLVARRRALERKLGALPGADKSYRDRIADARASYDEIDKRRSEVATQVQHAQAQLVAIERYMASGASIPKARRKKIERDTKALRAEIDKLRAELEKLERDITSGADTAAGGAALARREQKLRRELRETLDAESRLLSRLGAGRRQVARMRKANKVTGSVDRLLSRIDGAVDNAVDAVERDLAKETVRLGAYRRELENYESESADIGAALLGKSFRSVTDKFYDILVRTDVGVVDVAWSRQEEASDRFKRLTIDRAREQRTLRSDFADMLGDRDE